MTEETPDVRMARLEERIKASDSATKLAADALEAWKLSANEWRQTLQDRDARYVTRPEVLAFLLVGMAILGLILKYAK
jgi:hypothetical protein